MLLVLVYFISRICV